MDDEIIQSESIPLHEPNEPKKQRKVLSLILKILLITFIVVALGLSATLIYVRVKYPNPRYVSGTSMYPTLNADARRLVHDASGGDAYEPFFYNASSSLAFYPSSKDGDIVDYVFTEDGDDLISKLGRFDIVVTYYPDDLDDDGEIKETASPKIKRIIGMPGETISLARDDTPMGILTVDGEVVEQPGNTSENYNAPLKEAGYDLEYPSSSSDGVASHFNTWTIEEGHYFVCGDNRYGNFSSDSRSSDIGAVPGELIVARLSFVVGVCRIADNGGNCVLQLSSLRWPWEINNL